MVVLGLGTSCRNDISNNWISVLVDKNSVDMAHISYGFFGIFSIPSHFCLGFLSSIKYDPKTFSQLQAALRLSVKDQHVTQLVIESSDEEVD